MGGMPMGCQRSRGAYFFEFALVVACLFASSSTFAQSSGQTPPSAPSASPPASGEGKEIGGFQVTQSIELGGRITEVTGSQPMYDTLVNLQTGVRILEQSLTMQSLSHQDVFDTLTFNSFGWGGDPEQAARLRVAKYGWYTFSGSYQHMQNYFDYDLFANPLNPPSGGSPFIPILASPHSYFDRQNLYNFDLVVLPMHRVSFRVDYNRNRIIGPSFSSIHEGTEALTNQNWDNTLNGWRFGVDWRVAKKTTLSYTQMLQYYFGGATDGLNTYNSWPLSNGTPVTFGLPWFNSGSPCAAPLKNGIANPSCNGYFSYGLDQHVNTFIPTEQINLKSSSLKWLDFTGQYQYSHASSSTSLYETFSGLSTRSNNLGINTGGSSSNARWNTSSADITATIHINDQLRLVETFRFRNFSVAGNFMDLESSFFGAAPGPTNLLSSIATFPPTTLLHSSSSPADILNEITSNLIGQNMKQNDFQVQYDFSRFFGVRGGFNWTKDIIQPGSTYQAALGDIYYPNNPNRGNCVGVPLNPDGSCTFIGVIAPFGNPTTEINRYSGVLGAWFRKGSALHANFNAQFGGADNWIYRTDPLGFFNLKGNVSYTPRPWLMLGGNFIYEHATNDTAGINFNQHNYTTMFNATINPNPRWGLDLAYNFDAIQQNTLLCFQSAAPPAGSTPCLGDNSLMQIYGVYQTHTQYGYFAFTLTPIERV